LESSHEVDNDQDSEAVGVAEELAAVVEVEFPARFGIAAEAHHHNLDRYPGNAGQILAPGRSAWPFAVAELAGPGQGKLGLVEVAAVAAIEVVADIVAFEVASSAVVEKEFVAAFAIAAGIDKRSNQVDGKVPNHRSNNQKSKRIKLNPQI
jgi:hypothetical protein